MTYQFKFSPPFLPLKSFFLSLATAVSIAFSLGLAYALYTLVLRIKFFPFMNILASVIAVGKKICFLGKLPDLLRFFK